MSKTRIMLVEDERIVALNLKQRLTKLGYEIAALATSGASALQEIERSRPDVVLMDINIEGDIDGIETASLIPDEYRTPVIYLTAYSEQATLDRARATNPYGYLLKPFSERELHATIQMVLERRRADAALRESEQRLEKLVSERTAELEERTRALEEQTRQREVAEAAVWQAEFDAKLRRAQKMDAIGQLTGGIAHDFNNLLTVIVGNFDCLSELPDRSQERAELEDVALSAALRGSELTGRLLAFARQQPLSPRPVNLNARLPAIISMLERTLGETIQIRTSLAPKLWIADVDASQVEDALVNLAINARDAMPTGGILTIETRNTALDADYATANIDVIPGDYVALAVSDTGCGMPPDVVERAFEPFFSTKAEGRGTGLGLSMVYGFARQSQGHVKIYSEVGHGTTITLYLPRSASDEAAARDARNIQPLIHRTGNESILVIEDDNHVRAISVRHLTELGYRVRAVENGPAAIALLEGPELFDLVFTDIVMPEGMSGYDVATAALARRPGIKLLLTTGYAGPQNGPGSAKHTGAPLLRKPFRKQELAEAIRTALDASDGANLTRSAG
jgi:signal transduction histidine kinase